HQQLPAAGCPSGGGRVECNRMRIRFTRSGGVGGLLLSTTVDTDRLAAPDVIRLRELVEEAECFKLPPRIRSRQPQPDRFQYDLTSEDGSRQRAVTTDEDAMPASLRPLLTWLTQVARRAPRTAAQ